MNDSRNLLSGVWTEALLDAQLSTVEASPDVVAGPDAR